MRPTYNDPGARTGATGADGNVARQQRPSNSTALAARQAPTLRDYQLDVIARVETEIAAGRRRILLVAPTGSGKTIIAGELIRRARARGKRALFLAHRREIIGQTSRKLHDAGVDHGILLPGYPPRPAEKVQVASIATLDARAVRSRSIELPQADLVIVDEAHHSRARTYRRLIEAYPEAVVLGMTATPCRGDGRGLGGLFEVLVECPQVAALIQRKHLVPAHLYAPSRPDLTGVRIERGDYVESQLARRVNTAKLVGDIVEHWHRLAERRPSVIYASGVAHSVHIRDELRRSGVLAEHLDGSTPIEERDHILAQLAAGAIEAVANAMVLTEGWNCPAASCVVLARPTKSLGLYRQMVGRVLRPAPGKTDALILDHAGAVFQLGFPDDEITWTLHQDRRAENKAHAARGTYKAPALTDCPECHAVKFEGRPCPACGWQPRRKPEAVEVINGELGRVERDRSARPGVWTAEQKSKFHRKLLWIAKQRGYKPGWAANKHKEKFGDWPAAPPWRPPSPEPPEPATVAWVQSRMIAWARSQPRRPG